MFENLPSIKPTVTVKNAPTRAASRALELGALDNC